MSKCATHARRGALRVLIAHHSTCGSNIGVATCGVAELQLRLAAAVVRFGVLRIEADRLIVVSDGAFVVSLAVVRAAAAVVREGIFGIEPDRLSVVSDGPVVIVLNVVRVGAAVVREANFAIRAGSLGHSQRWRGRNPCCRSKR